VELGVGETVQCMIGGANRDPAYFSDANRFDIHRANAKDHVAFGAGRHFCLGAPLAKLEAQLVLERLLDWRTLTLDASRPAAPRGYEFRKPPSLWIRWD
jgi:cytochrome P450